ncbi:MAG: NADH-quinone oxidoreductase subunit NuoE [Ktedonobacterales bacterium]
MITDDVKARMREIVARYPSPRSGMLPCLHLVQETEGYVTAAGVLAVAEVVGAKSDEVESVVSFYSMYHEAPIGKRVIKVCTSISCYLRGCDDLLAHIEERLGVARNGTTADGGYTVQAVECLAACGMAPVLQVNDQFVENVSIQDVDTLLDGLARGEDVPSHPGDWNILRAGDDGGQTTAAANSANGKKAT